MTASFVSNPAAADSQDTLESELRALQHSATSVAVGLTAAQAPALYAMCNAAAEGLAAMLQSTNTDGGRADQDLALLTAAQALQAQLTDLRQRVLRRHWARADYLLAALRSIIVRYDPVTAHDSRLLEAAADALEAAAGKALSQIARALAATRTPDNYISGNAVLNNSMPQGVPAIDASETELPAGRGFSIYAALSIDPNRFFYPVIERTGKAVFTAYDRRVLNGVCSLWYAGNQHFTAAAVYRAMNGRRDHTVPSREALAAVDAAIEKMASLRIEIDDTEELQARRMISKNQGHSYSSCCINCVRHVLTTDGVPFYAYRLSEEPVLLSYARARGQVLSIPAEVLDIQNTDPDGGVKNGSRPHMSGVLAAVREYLIWRIEGIKGGRTGNRVLLSSLYEAAEIIHTRQAEAAARGHALRCLHYWQAMGYIAGYTQEGTKPIRAYLIQTAQIYGGR